MKRFRMLRQVLFAGRFGVITLQGLSVFSKTIVPGIRDCTEKQRQDKTTDRHMQFNNLTHEVLLPHEKHS